VVIRFRGVGWTGVLSGFVVPSRFWGRSLIAASKVTM